MTHRAPAEALAARVFLSPDQQQFARLSGDVNPMHMDDLAARRTQAGAAVVHGIHLVLWTLETLSRDGTPLAALRSLRVRFNKFVLVGRTASIRIVDAAAEVVKLEILADDLACVAMTLRFGERANAVHSVDDAGVVITHDAPMDRTIDELATIRGRLVSPQDATGLAARHFPAATIALGADRITALAQLSALVGMICPGLHSIFSELSVDIVTERPEARRGIVFTTTAVDDRFGLVSMDVAGSGIAGQVSAFVRARPIEPPSMASLAERVGEGDFAGSVALVVGGSRGLGAVTAKLIASGGGRVILTYARGAAEAESVARDIVRARGPNACSIVQLDVTHDPAATLAPVRDSITHVYYFATPQIFRQIGALFSSAVFDDFARVYLDGFCRTVEPLLARPGRGALRVLHPSSVAVETRPRGITEYAMAKAAAELLCADMAQRYSGSRIESPRLPRILTDQTATVSAVEAADAVETMLPLVRRLHAP